MAKFHINPKTGNPGECHAEKGGCPFGSPEEHFDDATAARTAYEKRMEAEGSEPITKALSPAEVFARDFADDAQAVRDLSLYEMLRAWRYAPIGAFQTGDPYSEFFQQNMYEKREANPGAWVAASKALSR